MTNGEKFKTAEERAKEFEVYCHAHKGKCRQNICTMNLCRYKWLELEYKEDLKPCPFCGSEASCNGLRLGLDERWYVCCSNPNCLVRPLTPSCNTRADAVERWERRA